MAWVNYQRILDGCSVSGKFGESLQVSERWQIRVDDPQTSKVDILNGVSTTAGVTWGSSHFEFPALKAMEFDLAPEGRDGMRWLLTVRYYVPPATKRPQENGIPEDVWERNGGTTTVPAFTDSAGDTITNAAGDPLEGLEKEREETSWSFVKYYEDEASLESDISAYAGKINSAEWAGGDEKTWKCYFKGAKKQSISKLDGDDDAGTLEYIESRWEFRYDPETWKLMPWDVGFMELVSGERKTIVGQDGKPVKQPVALNADGTKKSPGTAPSVINDGDGADVYLTADFGAGFGEPFFVEPA
jgi:hypothetical protein